MCSKFRHSCVYTSKRRRLAVNFGEKLKKLRAERHIKQEDLAELLGVSVRSLSNYENGLRFPKHKETYEKLAQIFQVDYNYLLDEQSNFVHQVYRESGKQAKDDAYALLNSLTALFVGGKLNADERDEIMRLLQAAYWQAKEQEKSSK